MDTVAAPEQAEPASKPARHGELDWLRILVVFGLIPVHTAVIFSGTSDLFLKSRQASSVMVVLGAIVGVWGMPLLFVVSGASAWFATGRRTPGQYVWERFLRLVIPFVFATVLIIPIQVYVVLLSNPSLANQAGIRTSGPRYLESYARFFPLYLRGYADFMMHPSFTGIVVFWGHLWFVPALFGFSLLTLPLFYSLRSSAAGAAVIAWLGAYAERPGVILLFAVPASLAEALLRFFWPGAGPLGQVVVYLLFFVYGYLLYADPRLRSAVAEIWGVALALGLASWVAAELLIVRGQVVPYDNEMGSILFFPLRGIIAWFWTVGVLGFAMTYLRRNSALQVYLNNAVFPVYVLHLPVIIVTGFFILRWGTSLGVSYMAIVATAFVGTLGVYDLLVLRSRITRFFFGVKSSQAPALRWNSARLTSRLSS